MAENTSLAAALLLRAGPTSRRQSLDRGSKCPKSSRFSQASDSSLCCCHAMYASRAWKLLLSSIVLLSIL